MRTRSSQQVGSSKRHPVTARVSYREPSTDGSASESNNEDSIIRPKLTRRTTIKTLPKPTRDTASKTISPSKLASRKRTSSRWLKSQPLTKRVKRGSVQRSHSQFDPIAMETSYNLPPWHTLPYEILLQIFQYASDPVCNKFFQPSQGATWLLRTALVCRTFTEPALSALYYSPPLSPPSRARSLIAHLAFQSQLSTYNYRSKVKYLEVEAISTLVQRSDGLDPVCLEDLIDVAPQLRGIKIHLLTDELQYRNQFSLANKRAGVVYKKPIFDALGRNKIGLLTWKWNFKFNNRTATLDVYPWNALKDIHSQASYQSLRSLTIVRYDSQTNIEESKLADAIRVLPNLKDLTLESCLSKENKLLPLLPRELESLQITGWSDLTSDILHPFLLTHGSNLRQLILDYNQSLNIAFLVDFAVACPMLETFKMNMTFYSSYATFDSSEPKFGALLLPNTTPTWPTTLQNIELLHLRKWYSTSAEVFIASLIDSAPNLLQLRRLVLKTSIEISWRDRATFRDRWIGRLRKVFLRRSPPPASFKASMNFVSGRTLLEGKASIPNAEETSHRPSRLRSPGSRLLSRVEISKDTLDTETDSDAPIAPPKTRRSSRLKEQDTDDAYGAESGPKFDSEHSGIRRSGNSSQLSDGDAGFGSTEDESKTKEPFIQGLCNVVDIRIDNLRPAQFQFSENDFLDEEHSGDEDWNGEDSFPADGGYAW